MAVPCAAAAARIIHNTVLSFNSRSAIRATRFIILSALCFVEQLQPPPSGNMAAPSLQHSALNLLSVKQLAERDFITALQMLRGKKALVLDATLSGPLGLITEKQTLRENGVEKTFHLLPEPLQTDQSQV